MKTTLTEKQKDDLIARQIKMLGLVEELIQKEDMTGDEVVNICIAILTASCTNQKEVDYIINEFQEIVEAVGFNNQVVN